MKIEMLFGFLIFPILIYGKTQSESELNLDGQISLHKSDSTLNAVYNKILNEYSTDKLFISKFKSAQKVWVELRDADLKALFPDTNEISYGSVYPMCVSYFLKERTDERIKYLMQWINKVEEGDVCSGSIMTKNIKKNHYHPTFTR